MPGAGSGAVDGLIEALPAKAVEVKALRKSKIRVDTTVVPANVADPTGSGLLGRRLVGSRRRDGGSTRLVARSAPSCGIGPGPPGGGRMI